MNCKNARPLIVLDFYGELEDSEKRTLDAHIRACPACAREREETRRALALVGEARTVDVPRVDAEKSWRKIQAGIRVPSRARARTRRPFGQWALAGAALAGVLIAGVLIGRNWRGRPAPLPVPGEKSAENGGAMLQPALASHLDDIQPLLLDYVHASGPAGEDRQVLVDESRIRALLLQNLLLRRALVRQDPAAADLLEDIDLVLKEISNRSAEAPMPDSEIGSLIQKRDILFKMRILKTT
jgi:hypothetical protein